MSKMGKHVSYSNLRKIRYINNFDISKKIINYLLVPVFLSILFLNKRRWYMHPKKPEGRNILISVS